MESVWISEYGRLLSATTTKQLKTVEMRTDAKLSEPDFKAVLDLLEDSDSTALTPVFKFSLKDGRNVLTAQNYVGVIQTPSGCQIEILPKTASRATVEQARELLVKMLIEVRDSPFKEGVLSNLEAQRRPLFELILSQFLNYVGDIIRKGIARKYVEQQGNLVFLRGKLQISEHIKRNMIDQSRFYCEYDEYERNRPINRLIKGALEVVQKVSRNTSNRQLSREFLYWFDQVPSTKNYLSDFRAIKQDRFVHHYQKALPICKLILARLNPLTKQGKSRCISVLFDMNRVFENYVAAKLITQFPDWRISTQVSSKHLIENHNGKSLFRLIPDLEFRRDYHKVIADTKWKLIDENEQGYGISQADMYQLFAYLKKYLGSDSEQKNQIKKEVVLIYPKTTNFTKPLRPFYYDSSRDEILHVFPFDLENDELITAPDYPLFSEGKEVASRVA